MSQYFQTLPLTLPILFGSSYGFIPMGFIGLDNPGLTRRRQAEINIFRDNHYKKNK
jgi:hypothetical protein